MYHDNILIGKLLDTHSIESVVYFANGISVLILYLTTHFKLFYSVVKHV